MVRFGKDTLLSEMKLETDDRLAPNTWVMLGANGTWAGYAGGEIVSGRGESMDQIVGILRSTPNAHGGDSDA